MERFLFICAGGALGTGARYALSTWGSQRFGAAFPHTTILINITGSFLISVIMELSISTTAIAPTVRAFLTTGIIGGFTTYSAFNYDTIHLLEQSAWLAASLNLALTVVCCLLAGTLGLAVAQAMVRSRVK